MALLNFSVKHTLAQALASSNLAKLFFPTDSNSIVIGNKEYGRSPVTTLHLDWSTDTLIIEDIEYLPDIKISEEMATKYAGEHGIKYMSVSTKEGLNIGFLFELIATKCVSRITESQTQEIKEKDDDDIKKLKKENNIDALSIEDNNKKVGVEKKPRKKCC